MDEAKTRGLVEKGVRYEAEVFKYAEAYSTYVVADLKADNEVDGPFFDEP